MAVPAPKVELFIDGAWVNVTSYMQGGPKFILNRGEVDEHGRLRTTVVEITLKNSIAGSVGIWSNDNPSSIYYRKLVPGLPIRFSMDTNVRAVLAVRDWPQRWTHGQKYAYVPITCTGVLGQLAQGGKALESPVYRDVMRRHNDQYRVAYWSMEEDSSATQLSSPMANVLPLSVENFDSLTLSAFESPGSRNLPTVATGVRIKATVPNYTSDQHKVVTFWNFPGAITDLTVMQRMFFSGGSIAFIDLIYGTISGGSLKLTAYSAAGTVLDQTGFGGFTVDGEHFLTSLEFVNDGADVDVVLLYQEIDTADPDAGSLISDTFTGLNVGRIQYVNTAAGADMNGVSVGHLSVSNSTSGVAGLADSSIGHIGETAALRLFRLCNEEDIAFVLADGDASLTAPMGIQGRDTMTDIFNECITADQGILYETRTDYAITYHPGYLLSNQAAEVTFDHDASHLGEDMPESSTDDFLVHNDVTVRRSGGGFARAVIDSGRLSVNSPPDGIGTYDRGPITANVETDDQLIHLAGWIANVRSPEDRRWPKVTIELHRKPYEDSSTLRAAVIGLNIGDVFGIESLPVFVSPEVHYCLVRGYREECDKFTWKIVFYTTPYWPLEVTPIETSGSTLVHAVSTSATSWQLATSQGPEWDESYEPYLLQANGEAVEVVTIETNTPSFLGAASGDHDDNASVTPGLPLIAFAAGDIMILVAAIRNTAATVNTPTGWTVLNDTYTNFKVFGRYWVSGDAAPTVTFSGGSAGDTTSGQIAAWRGPSLELDDGRYGASATASPQTSSNSSAANIAYPALSVRRAKCAVLIIGWKQDDWTSVATPASMDAEVAEESSTLGSDQGIAWYYDLQSTATDLAAGSLVVTGGASAISRAITLALRPLQTATVVRGMNGVNVAIDAAEPVTTWRLGVSLL
jgi:hypothetical protein